MVGKNFSVHLQGISKYFGQRPVLQDVTLVHEKGILGISGSNGSGKSTLMRCMAGLWSLSKGSVEWQANGAPIGMDEVKQSLGYAAPYINLYNELSCYRNLFFILKLRNVTKKKDRIDEVLTRTGMQSFSDRSFRRLSTGQKQRMRLAAALVHQPDILFLDEPGSNLDKAGTAMICSLVDTFKAQGKFVAIASNNESELNLCDHVYSVETKKLNERKAN